jgi:dUTP pyrophosphatase
MKIKVFQTALAKGLPLPKRAYPSDVGFDLATVADLAVGPGEVAMIPTGLVFDLPTKRFTIGGIPHQLALVVEPRTGRGREGLIPAARVVDAGYRSEPNDVNGLTLALRNVGKDLITLQRGDRVAQGLFHLIPIPALVLSDARGINWDTDRKGGRFGSTGK